MTVGVDRVLQKQYDKEAIAHCSCFLMTCSKKSIEFALQNKINNIWKNTRTHTHILSFCCWSTYTCVIPIRISWSFLLKGGHSLSKWPIAVPTGWKRLFVSKLKHKLLTSSPAHYYRINKFFPPTLQQRFMYCVTPSLASSHSFTLSQARWVSLAQPTLAWAGPLVRPWPGLPIHGPFVPLVPVASRWDQEKAACQ